MVVQGEWRAVLTFQKIIRYAYLRCASILLARSPKSSRNSAATKVSSSQVSTCAAKLNAELKLWRDHSLVACPYLIFDGRDEKVRHGGLLRDGAVLIAIGVGTDGKSASAPP